jgi:hypothetical protein
MNLAGSATALNSAYDACIDAHRRATADLLRPIERTVSAPGRWL